MHAQEYKYGYATIINGSLVAVSCGDCGECGECGECGDCVEIGAWLKERIRTLDSDDEFWQVVVLGEVGGRGGIG